MKAAPGSKAPLLILGAGGFGEEVAALAASDGRYEPVAFVESLDRSKVDTSIAGLPVIWNDDIAALVDTHLAVCALGTTRRRAWIEQAALLGFDFASIRHPSAQLAPSCTIGRGTILGAGTIVGAGARIGDHVLLNRGSLIGHHAQIGDFVTISSGANVGGTTTIGVQTFVGMGAIVLNDRSVGSGAIVGAGAVVTRHVPDRVQVLGCPARITRRNVEAL